MLKNEKVIVETDAYTPLEYISDTMCYAGDENIDIKTQFLALFGVDGQKIFFKTLFYIFKLRGEIGENEFSDLFAKYMGDKSVFSIFNSYACDEVLRDSLYLNELFSILDIDYSDIERLYNDDSNDINNNLDKNQKMYRKKVTYEV